MEHASNVASGDVLHKRTSVKIADMDKTNEVLIDVSFHYITQHNRHLLLFPSILGFIN